MPPGFSSLLAPDAAESVPAARGHESACRTRPPRPPEPASRRPLFEEGRALSLSDGASRWWGCTVPHRFPVRKAGAAKPYPCLVDVLIFFSQRVRQNLITL